MRLLSRVLLLGVSLAMAIGGAACNDAAPDNAEAEADESALSPGSSLALGPIAPGETKVVDYTPMPRYRSFSFSARKGAKVEFWVRSTDGDAVAYIVGADGKTLVRNDDADDSTSDAHVSATIREEGTYLVALKNLKARNARLTVSFTASPPAPRVVGVTWNDNVLEIHEVDPATMSHALIARLPDIVAPSGGFAPFADPTRGVVYVRGAGADAEGLERWYGVDARTGAIVSSPVVPRTTVDAETGAYHGFYFKRLVMTDNGAFVGTMWNGNLGQAIHRVDPRAMTQSFIAPIPDVVSVDGIFAGSGVVYVRGNDVRGVTRLYGMNNATGAIVSSPLMPRGLDFRDDDLLLMPDGRFVGATWNGNLFQEELREIDPSTMTHSLLGPIPGIASPSSTRGSFAIDSIAYVRGYDRGGAQRLYGIDSKSGAVLSSPLVAPVTCGAPTQACRGLGFELGFHVIR